MCRLREVQTGEVSWLSAHGGGYGEVIAALGAVLGGGRGSRGLLV